MQKIPNIAKNTSYLTAALIIQKVISFAFFTLLARNLGPEDIGKYYFAISFTTIFSIFIDFGFTNVLTREIAKYQIKAESFLANVLAIKIPLAIFTYFSLLIAINLLGYSAETKELVYLSSICMILDSFTATFFGVARGFHNLKYESLSSIIFQVIVIVFGLSALYSGMSLQWIMISLVAASIFNFIYSALIVKTKIQIRLRPKFNYAILKNIIWISIPFGVYLIFQRFYTYFDTVLLSYFAGNTYVGYYQIPSKIIVALQFMPMAFTASLYPAMSGYWKSNKEQLAITFERAINYLIIISLPISAGIIILSNKIILIFKSDFYEAVLPMQIIMLALFFIFINYPIGSLLNACDKQKQNTVNMGIIVLISIGLNLFLIPKYQAVGASITVLITNILMVTLGLYWVPKIITLKPKKIMLIFLKSILSVFIMAISLYLTKKVSIFLQITLAGIVYFYLMYIFKAFRQEDIMSIWNSFRKKAEPISD